MHVLIINGHPAKDSFSKSMALAYAYGAKTAGNEVLLVHIGELAFDPVLREGYHVQQPLEPDLEEFQKKVLWAKHIVIVYPTWWGGMPAILKGLFDRCFLPGFAFKYHEKDPFWDKLLLGRTAHIITTMDAPWVWYWLFNHRAGTNMLKHGILEFCGISPVKSSCIGRMRNKTSEELKKELVKITEIAANIH